MTGHNTITANEGHFKEVLCMLRHITLGLHWV